MESGTDTTHGTPERRAEAAAFVLVARIEASYPQFVEFLKLKRRYDPAEMFQSDWYRHHKAMFADRL